MAREPKNPEPVRERSYQAPYHEYPEFEQGFKDYREGITRCPYDPNSVQAQAWDRGAEYASYLFWLKQRDRETD